MRVRQYSISSSPLWNARRVTLTVSIVDAPALSGRPHHFLGVGTSFLSNLRPGDRVQMAVRPSAPAFHLPEDPSVPVVMFCAGSGLAPMRGFVQERAEQKKAGRDVGKMLLYVGCRNPREDLLYGDAEVKDWMEAGVVDVRPAFSRVPEESAGCKYVQECVCLAISSAFWLTVTIIAVYFMMALTSQRLIMKAQR
jgi:cytochrome P450/NADPH-cytochrome P450 reductase